ncbi:hypothetical protein [Nakamurella endophytica]|uniref:DUF2029 domain-containing protein n=1 Tax=Nakamurella endophytica TaxID=1748367 RepID=A0A917WH97_9ACTN|nr:hypothetical protein [Nakamurella endophytica]GGM03226.1 hypothetical protein GCM10011594_24230 [Nakamurella endophytica]
MPAALLVLTLLFTGLTLTLGYVNKQRCVGPEFTAVGQSEPDLTLRITRDVCYTDLQYLWTGRELYLHRFPYLHGSYDPVTRQISGGTLEYPVLTGVVIWLTSLPSHDDAEFLAWNAPVLALCGLLVAVLLHRLAGIRAWWYALGPPLVLYAYLNWDLLAVAAVVGAFALLSGLDRSRHPGLRLLGCAVLLGVGGALKFYPLMFAAPIALWVGAGLAPERSARTRVPAPAAADGLDGPDAGAASSTPGRPALPATAPARRSVLDGSGERQVRWTWAVGVLLTTATVFALANLPFMIAGFDGWWASFRFQWSRPIDVTTNSIWFWGARPDGNADNLALQGKLGTLSTVSTAVGMVLALLGGAWRARRVGAYPWLQVGAAMLAAYLLLNKVHSPQYVLWLLPFFVLLRVRAGWILAYLVADVAMGVGFFRWQYLLYQGKPSGVYDSLAAQALMIGVWGRAALLVGLFVAFLGAEAAPRPVWASGRPTCRKGPAGGAVDSSADGTGRARTPGPRGKGHQLGTTPDSAVTACHDQLADSAGTDPERRPQPVSGPAAPST